MSNSSSPTGLTSSPPLPTAKAIEALVTASAEETTLLSVSATNGLLLNQIEVALQTIATNSGETKCVEFTAKTTDSLATAMSKVIAADFELRFSELHQRLSATDKKVADLDKGLSASNSEVGHLTTNLKGLDESLNLFRDNTHTRLELMREEIRQTRDEASAAIADSEIVEAEVAELAAGTEKRSAGAIPVQRASGSRNKGRGK
jgi:hypothetical protein